MTEEAVWPWWVVSLSVRDTVSGLEDWDEGQEMRAEGTLTSGVAGDSAPELAHSLP